MGEGNPVEVKLILPEAHSKKQRLIMTAFQMPAIRKIFVACGTKYGKAQYYLTLTPTPDRGYIPLKEIKAGDFVFDEHGKPTRVVRATELMYDHECFKLTFSDGTQVIADAEHDWVTTTHAERKSMARALSPKDRCKSTEARPTKRKTLEIFNTQTVVVSGVERPNHAIPAVTAPLEFSKRELPVPPYTLGVWLGDGSSWGGEITKPDAEIFEYISAEGFSVTQTCGQATRGTWRVEGLTALLKKHGLYLNKHVPPDYLVSSPDDRAALLQGLMDTDGTVDKRGNCCFDNTRKDLADTVALLAMSLGIKVNRSGRIGRLNGVDKKWCYRVMFTTDFPVFRLRRKADKQKKEVTLKSKQRTIVSVERVESVPVMCIQVENPTHLFLTTEACIPTHNSLSASACLGSASVLHKSRKWRWIAPIYEQAKVGMDYFRKILPGEPHSEFRDGDMRINMPYLDSEIQFWHCKNPMSLEGPGIHGNIFDEAAKCPYEAVAAAQTTVTFTKGPQGYFSTPFGKNWFYRECMEAKEHMDWCVRNGRLPERIFLTAPTTDNRFIDPKVVAEAKRSLPDRLFRQYYLAEFVDDGSVFIGFRDCIQGAKLEVYGGTQRWVHPEAKTFGVFFGIDWAKKDDYTVITAMHQKNGKPYVSGFLRFQGLSYVEALKELYAFAKEFKTIINMKHDKTGVGEAIDDMLAQLGLPFEGVVFTNPSKSAMVNELIMAFQRKDIVLPYWPEMISELESYSVVVNDLGTARYSAPSGLHDDIVSSLMLANAAAREYSSEFKLNFLEDLPQVKMSVEQWYNDLADDGE